MIELVIDEELRKLIPPLDSEERRLLEESIFRDGCRHPLIVWEKDGQRILIDGHNRYDICRTHGAEFDIEIQPFEDRGDVIIWMVKNQMGRRNLTPFQRAELAMILEPEIAEKAKANQIATLKKGASAPVCQNSDKRDIDTKKELAKVAGVSHDTIAKAKVITQKADPETVERVRRGDESINAAYTKIKREEKEQKREERRQQNLACVQEVTESGPLDSLSAKFATIVIDPPWDWGDEGDVDQLGRAKPTYHTMSFDDLLELPVGFVSDVDCHIYLWITNRSLPKGFTLLEQWGFRYVTCLTWCKPSFGMGNYFRGSTEQVLFGVRGSQPLKRKDVGTWFQMPRGPQGHSSKPVDFYPLVESCSPGPYLELFARSNRDNWISWGAEV